MKNTHSQSGLVIRYICVLCLCLFHECSHWWNKRKKYKRKEKVSFSCACACSFAYFSRIHSWVFLCLCICFRLLLWIRFKKLLKVATIHWEFSGPKESLWHGRSKNSFKKTRILWYQRCSNAWFASYLSNRKQFILIGDSNSDFQSFICGVLQVKALSLDLYFSLYT